MTLLKLHTHQTRLFYYPILQMQSLKLSEGEGKEGGGRALQGCTSPATLPAWEDRLSWVSARLVENKEPL